jgi:cobalamin biosynthesis Mg chelatase CobN
MADPQDRPDNPPGHTPGDADPAPPAAPAPPADVAPPQPPAHGPGMPAPPADAPEAPAKKAPGKKAPAKAAKAAKKSPPAAPKKAAAKKAPAKKPPKKAPAKKAPATPTSQPGPAPAGETNGHLAAAAKDAAAHAKSTVEAASNPVPGQAVQPSANRSPVPWLVAIAVSLLAVLLVRQLRQRGSDG